MMERFAGIPFVYLPQNQRVRLANQLDQVDGTGKDYMVFAQNLERLCGYRYGILEENELKVMKHKPYGPTLALFDSYCVHRPGITLDLVYKVLQDMGLEDCLTVLNDSRQEIIERQRAGIHQPCSEGRPMTEHRCTCVDCKPSHSVTTASIHSNNIHPRCHPSSMESAQRTYHHQHSTNCEHSIHAVPSSEHCRSVIQSPNLMPQNRQMSNTLFRREHESHFVPRGANMRDSVAMQPQCPPPHIGQSTSTVQLPLYQGSSLQTPDTRASPLLGPHNGAIPKQPCRHPTVNRQISYREVPPTPCYNFAHNEPATLQNDPNHNYRICSPVNDLGKDSEVRDLKQCTCPRSIKRESLMAATGLAAAEGFKGSQESWYPPSEMGSDDEDSDETKVLQVVESSNYSQPSNKTDAERRYSDPLENQFSSTEEDFSSSDNCSDGVRRSRSNTELQTKSQAPMRSMNSYKAKNQIKVFLTFADDSEQHLEEVLEFGAKLKQMGYSVKCDMFDQTIRKLISQPSSLDEQNSLRQFFSNTLEWLQYQVHNATFLVFCISPKYFQYVRPQEQAAAVAHPTNCHLHTKYIYNQAFAEHLHSLAQNKRFFPVLFLNSGADQRHIPGIFRSTVIFNYPDPHNSLLAFLGAQLRDVKT